MPLPVSTGSGGGFDGLESVHAILPAREKGPSRYLAVQVVGKNLRLIEDAEWDKIAVFSDVVGVT